MRVLLCSPYSEKRSGGIGSWTKGLLESASSDQQVDLFHLNTSFSLKRILNGSSFRRFFVGVADACRTLFLLFFYLAFRHPDVVHYTSSASFALYKDYLAYLIIQSIFRKKMIIHWHFGGIPDMAYDNTKEYRLLLTICKKVWKVIVIDKDSFYTLSKEGVASVLYIPNSIPHYFESKTRSWDFNEVQESRKDGSVLFVGHVLRSKGVCELVKVCASIPEIKELVLVGACRDSALIQELVQLSKRRDNGEWLCILGERNKEEIIGLYKECSVFCLPSYSEGFPYVVLEAMACACPIVSTHVGAIPEMLEGQCGFVVPPKDEIALQEQLWATLSAFDSSKLMGLRARERVMKEYSSDSIYMKYKHAWGITVL